MLGASVASAADFTYLDHQKNVNKIICEKKCLPDCAKLNAAAEANPGNKTTVVNKGKSGGLRCFTRHRDLRNIFEKSIQDACALTALK